MAAINPPEALLSIERLHELFCYDSETGVLTRKIDSGGRFGRAGDVANRRSKEGYLTIVVRPRTYRIHRLVWAMHYGKWPTEQIDHINRIKTDNRIANLREVTPSENSQNCGVRPQNKSGVTGVAWKKSKKKWVAYIGINRKHVEIGTYRTYEEAVLARLDAQRRLHPFFNSDAVGTPSPDSFPARPSAAAAYVVAEPRPRVPAENAVKAAALCLRGEAFKRVAELCGFSETYVRMIMKGQARPKELEEAKRLICESAPAGD